MKYIVQLVMILEVCYYHHEISTFLVSWFDLAYVSYQLYIVIPILNKVSKKISKTFREPGFE